jgi:hypothetical protein
MSFRVVWNWRHTKIEKYCLLGCDALLNVTDVTEEHISIISGPKNETSELTKDAQLFLVI